MDGGAAQVQHDMVADQRNYGWNYDAALRSMWLKEGCCSDAEEREVHTACLRCVSVPGGHNWWTLSVYDLCVQPPTLRIIWLLSPLPCMQAEKGYREARRLPFPHVSQWACAATALLPNTLSLLLLSVSICTQIFSCGCQSPVLAQFNTPIVSHYLLFRTLYPCLLSNGD